MLATMLRQARGNAGRLAAAGLAVVLGTAFLTTVLLGSAVLQRTLSNAVLGAYAGADVVVEPVTDQQEYTPLTDADLARVRALPAVAGVHEVGYAYVEVASATRSEGLSAGIAPDVPALQPTLAAGRLPDGPGQAVVHQALADRLQVGIGDTVTVSQGYGATQGGATGGSPVRSARIVGLLPGAVSWLGTEPGVLADRDTLTAWAALPQDDYAEFLLVAKDGTAPADLRDQVRAALGPDAQAATAEDYTAAVVDEVSGETDVLTNVLAAFAVLALAVAGLVITNTLAVLVGQRTRQLALLRCIGATTGQVRRSVVGEAAVLGLLATLVGIAAGVGVTAAAVAVAARALPAVEIARSVDLTLLSVLAPLALGVLVTVLAALAPARAATRVAPLAALRPTDAPDLRVRASRLRLVLAVGLVVLGGALLAAGVAAGLQEQPDRGLLLGMPGGLLSFVGILVGAVFWLPPLTGLLGRLAGLVGGAPARITAANTVRNPRRTAVTAGALLIGATLVTTVLVGAASAKQTMNAAVDVSYPVDVVVGESHAGAYPLGPGEEPLGQPASLPAPVADAVRGVPGVGGAEPVRVVTARSTAPTGTFDLSLLGVDPGRIDPLLAQPGRLAALQPGVALMQDEVVEELGVREGQELTVTVGDRAKVLRVAVFDVSVSGTLVTEADLAGLAPAAPVTHLWANLEPGADAVTTVGDVQQAVTTATGAEAAPQVAGPALERAAFTQAIDVLLLIVTGLLGVAVVIAVVGVANTLSLSVIERTRESALMRALGLTRGQLRAMLTLEGLLLAGVAGLLSVGLGAVYGWAGATVLLGSPADQAVSLALPWSQLGLVVVAALVAGALASLLPGRRAARTPPVAALAE